MSDTYPSRYDAYRYCCKSRVGEYHLEACSLNSGKAESYKSSAQEAREVRARALGLSVVEDPKRVTTLPTDSKARKDVPLARGLLDYFPAALAAVAVLSRMGNEKHNPGEDMHWARGKSSDHADCILRHLIDRGTIDPEDGISHTVKVAWRALALLQEELEAKGAPPARGARFPTADDPAQQELFI